MLKELRKALLNEGGIDDQDLSVLVYGMLQADNLGTMVPGPKYKHLKHLQALCNTIPNGQRMLLAKLLIQYVRVNRHVAEYSDNAAIGNLIADAIYGPFAARITGHDIGEEKSALEQEVQAYEYIPSGRIHCIRILDQFMQGFYSSGDKQALKFVDVGSGMGDKVIIANLMGFDATGVEINDMTHYTCKTVTNAMFYYGHEQNLPHWIHANAFDLSFADYDLVYMYAPAMGDKWLDKLYQHIAKTMKVGAFMFECQGLHHPISALKKIGITVNTGGHDVDSYKEELFLAKQDDTNFAVMRKYTGYLPKIEDQQPVPAKSNGHKKNDEVVVYEGEQ